LASCDDPCGPIACHPNAALGPLMRIRRGPVRLRGLEKAQKIDIQADGYDPFSMSGNGGLFAVPVMSRQAASALIFAPRAALSTAAGCGAGSDGLAGKVSITS